MNQFEIDLLNNEDQLSWMEYLLKKHQFSEEFLAKTVGYYDSWKCLRHQDKLSPYFCFRYLYDNDTDSADDWTDYNQVVAYLKRYNYSDEEINTGLKKALADRNYDVNAKD